MRNIALKNNADFFFSEEIETALRLSEVEETQGEVVVANEAYYAELEKRILKSIVLPSNGL